MGQNEPYCTYGNSSGPGSNRVRWSLHIIHFKHVLTQLLTVSAFKWPHSGYMPCEKLFKRQQELFGHTCIQSFHLSYCLYPPYSGCHWRGHQEDDARLGVTWPRLPSHAKSRQVTQAPQLPRLCRTRPKKKDPGQIRYQDVPKHPNSTNFSDSRT